MDAWPGGNLVTALSAFLDVSSLNLAVPQGAAILPVLRSSSPAWRRYVPLLAHFRARRGACIVACSVQLVREAWRW